MAKYNHAYTLAFSLEGSSHPKGEDVTPAMLRAAIIRYLANLDDDSLESNCETPFDSYLYEEED